jgi:hypothetical protein
MSEILNNMRAVKLYAYESHLGRKITAIRQEETAVLRQYGMLRATINSLFSFVPVIAIVCESRAPEAAIESGLANATSDFHHLLERWK